MYRVDVYGQGVKTYGCDQDYYREVKNPSMWQPCPICKVKPLVLILDNIAITSCCCVGTREHHIRCESLISRQNRKSDDRGKPTEEILCEHWNHWVETGEDLFKEEYQKIKEEQGIEIW